MAHVNIVLDALERYVGTCESHAHELCGGDAACVEALIQHRERHYSDSAARSFDVGAISSQFSGVMPDYTWPSTALLRLVHDQTLAAPWSNPLRRSIAVTSALARLAERGIPADAIMRTCLGPVLIRHILLNVATMWLSVGRGDFEPSNIPRHFEPWFAIFDKEPALKMGADLELNEVVVAAMNGLPNLEAKEWIRNAAIAHLLDWRIDNFLRVKPSLDETVLPAGRDATQWIFDRFTKTSTDDWEKTSLEWELVFAHHPKQVASQVAVPLDLLLERPCSDELIVESMRRRLLTSVGDDPIVGDLKAIEILETIISLLNSGQYEQARLLSRRAREIAPNHQQVSNAMAFCTIPFDPREARRLIDQLVNLTPFESVLATVNRISSYIVEGNLDEAKGLLSGIRDPYGMYEAYLWEPVSLEDKVPEIRWTRVDEWIVRAMSVCSQIATSEKGNAKPSLEP